MRLEGSLDAFSLPDIFQLLSFTKKTGALHLRRDGLHGVVYVTTGSLTGGSSDIRRQSLARRLVGANAVADDALASAVDSAAESEDLGVARALQQAGAVDEGLLHELTAEHVIDTVFDLLRWAEGDFAFVVDETNPDDIGASVPVEDAVTEARRRLDVWAGVSTTIPSPDSVVALAVAPPEDPAMSRDEWALLALVDGRRTVAQVVAATGRGEFAVVSALAALVDRGLLAVADAGQAPAVNSVLERLAVLNRLEDVDLPTEAPAAPVIEEAPEAPAARKSGDVSDRREAVSAAAEALANAANAIGETPSQRTSVEETVLSPTASAPSEVIPPRAEPFLPQRRPEHLDDEPSTHTVVGGVDGTAAMAAVTEPAYIERDPSVNKSLLLRLIAGVRGL